MGDLSKSAARSNLRHGRHRAKRRGRIEPYSWLGAGAITFGVGAAMLTGAGVAHADDGSSDGGDSSSSSPGGSTSTSNSTSHSADSETSTSATVAGRKSSAPAPESKVSTSSTRDDGDSPSESASNRDEPTGKSKPAVSTTGRPAKPPATISVAKLSSFQADETAPPQPAVQKSGTESSTVAAVTEGGLSATTVDPPPDAPLIDFTVEKPDVANSTTMTMHALPPSEILSPKLAVAVEPSTPNTSTAPIALSLAGFAGLATTSNSTSSDVNAELAASATVAASSAPKVAVVDNFQLTRPANAAAASTDGKYVYFGDGEQAISIIDTKTKDVTTITVPNKYGDLAAAGNYLVATSYQSRGVATMTVVDTRTNRVVNQFTINILGDSPSALALDGNGSSAYLVSHDGWVTRVNVQTGTVTKATSVGGYLDGEMVAISGNKLVVGRDDSSYGVSILNLDTDQVTELIPGGSTRGIAVSPDGTRAYVASEYGFNQPVAALIVIDLATQTIVDTVDVHQTGSVGQVMVRADGKYIYYTSDDRFGSEPGGTLTVLAAASFEQLDQIRYDGRRGELAISKDGKTIYLAAAPRFGEAASVYAISTTVGNDYTGPQDAIQVLKDVVNFVGFLDDVTDALNRLPTVWNLGALFRLNSLVQGMDDIRVGIEKGDLNQVLSGFVDVAVAVLPKPATIFIEVVKFAISVVLPITEEAQQAFLDFRAQCMFRKSVDQLDSGEAARFAATYGGLGSFITIPVEYARYNVGGWFGSPQC